MLSITREIHNEIHAIIFGRCNRIDFRENDGKKKVEIYPMKADNMKQTPLVSFNNLISSEP